jgi:hypothetical protein
MELGRRKGRNRKAAGLALAAALSLAMVIFAAPAAAHVERASYWPNPAPEKVGGSAAVQANKKLEKKIKKAKRNHQPKKVKKLKRKRKQLAASASQLTGGAVPTIRNLFTALDKSPPGDTQIVCQGTVPKSPQKKIKRARQHLHGKALKHRVKKLRRRYDNQLNANDSIQALNASITDAQTHGYKLRASQPALSLTDSDANQLRDFNKTLLAECSFHSIQAAVTASHNNDRVVIMPGLYTEPASRAAPANDPKCSGLKETNDHGTTGALSYKYVSKCPNDQNLVAVVGRATTDKTVPQPPALDRHGIPDAGPCIRCNLQMEGSGVKPDDVTIDGGDPALGDHSPPGNNPPPYAKDIAIRVDRADGFVVRNLKTRHVNEHGVYQVETDGFLLDRVKMSYNSEYGFLSFVADHSLIENCDAWGSGDAAIYPGATADLGDAVPANQRRYGTELRNCDGHHSAAGFSGTDSNAVWIHHVNFYDNTLGYTTDVFTAPGHPGFPQDSNLVENNNFYSNNFNLYLPACPAGKSPGPPVEGQNMDNPGGNCSDVVPTVPEPVGTGLWLAGGNHNIIRKNHFWDNWRRGTMVFAVPDQLVCGPGGSVDPSQLAGCDPTKVPPSTSYNNESYGNSMGRRPDGTPDANGTDFWWDEYSGNTGNCWPGNTGKDGTRGSLTSTPPQAATPGVSLPHFLPEDCGTSVGAGGPSQDSELVACLAAFQEGAPAPCDWFTTPAEPAP